jgi:hypothetical protein
VRILAVLASICFVASFSLALLLPATLTLAGMIARIDHMVLVHVQDVVRTYVGDWLWTDVAIPILARPDWLPPLLLGIVFAGAAVTTASRQAAPRSRHRRP